MQCAAAPGWYAWDRKGSGVSVAEDGVRKAGLRRDGSGIAQLAISRQVNGGQRGLAAGSEGVAAEPGSVGYTDRGRWGPTRPNIKPSLYKAVHGGWKGG